MRFFRGSHFVLVGWDNVDFYIFYFGIGSAYPELPIQVEVKIRLSIKMRALWAPRPPATKIGNRHSKKKQFLNFAHFSIYGVDFQPLQHRLCENKRNSSIFQWDRK